MARALLDKSFSDFLQRKRKLNMCISFVVAYSGNRNAERDARVATGANESRSLSFHQVSTDRERDARTALPIQREARSWCVHG